MTAENESSQLPPSDSLIPHFKFERLLNQDQAGRRIILLGTIHSKPTLLLAERAPFRTTTTTEDETSSNAATALSSIASTLRAIEPLGSNDIYSWALASSGTTQPPDLKINLIHPCGDSHIRKYRPQTTRSVTESPAVYANRVRPMMARARDAGRLNWVFNIIEGRTEQEDVMHREKSGSESGGGSGSGAIGETGFLLLPDLNWDRKTLVGGLHLLGIVERRDIWSLRDLKKTHVPWLREMKSKLVAAVVKMWPELEEDVLKFYVHYQPTYYHFHIHVVHAGLEPGATQSVGKAFGLENIISQLEGMPDGKGMADVSITYTIGEASELWNEVFLPLKEERLREATEQK